MISDSANLLYIHSCGKVLLGACSIPSEGVLCKKKKKKKASSNITMWAWPCGWEAYNYATICNRWGKSYKASRWPKQVVETTELVPVQVSACKLSNEEPTPSTETPTKSSREMWCSTSTHMRFGEIWVWRGHNANHLEELKVTHANLIWPLKTCSNLFYRLSGQLCLHEWLSTLELAALLSSTNLQTSVKCHCSMWVI